MSHTETRPSNRVSRARTWRRRIGLILFGLCFGAVLVEVGLRLMGVHYATFGALDAERGWALMPGLADYYTLEGRSYVAINRDGYRDHQRSRDKPAGIYRIAVLGDSFVEAREVELAETFCSVLERKLNADGTFSPLSVEVLNFGVSGYGTAQEFLTLQHDVLAFQPDAVLLAFFSGNDLLDNSRQLDPSTRKDLRPYYDFSGDEFVLDDSFRSSSSYRRRSSLLGRTAYFLRDRLRIVQLPIGVLYGPADTRGRQDRQWRDELGLSSDVYKDPVSPDWTDAWRVTDRLMVDMNRFCQQRAMGFGVVTLTNGIQVYPDAKVRQSLIDELGVRDLFYPERRVAALGQQAGFPVLNLAPPMQKQADKDGTYFHGFENTQFGWGHWNVDGHEFVAEHVAGWLADPSVKSQMTFNDAPGSK